MPGGYFRSRAYMPRMQNLLMPSITLGASTTVNRSRLLIYRTRCAETVKIQRLHFLPFPTIYSTRPAPFQSLGVMLRAHRWILLLARVHPPHAELVDALDHVLATAGMEIG